MSFWRQLTSAARRLRFQPGFAAAAIGTLALGIAAPTALFAVVNATLLAPLPYPRYQDLYTLRTYMTDGRFTNGGVANEELNQLLRIAPAISASANVMRVEDAIVTDGDARQVSSFAVFSPGFFELAGLPMAAGSAFALEDFNRGAARRVVLSQRLWATMFSADPRIVGSTIRLGSGSAQVAGVAAAAFDLPHDADLWVNRYQQENIGHSFTAYIRLQPGATAATIASPLAQVFTTLAKKYPDQEQNRAFVVHSLRDDVLGQVKPIIVMAFVATALLWLLALVNVANLWLARGTARGREMAVRSALGASRWNLAAQLLAESLVIAAVAATVGFGVVYASVRLMARLGAELPRVAELAFTPQVFLFGVLAMGIAGALVALAPIALVGDGGLSSAMKEGGRSGTQNRATQRLLGAMIAGEVMLAIALVAGAGRLLVSIDHLLAIDPGFVSDGRLVADVLLPREYFGPRAVIWAADTRERLLAAGADRVAFASAVPLGREWDTTILVDILGRPTAPENRPNARLRTVSPEFFDVIGARVVAGRGFTNDDRRETERALVVSQTWAKRFLPGLDPLRERIAVGGFDSSLTADEQRAQALPIVGVVSDVQYTDVMQPDEPVLDFVYAQAPVLRASIVITTSDGHPERHSAAFRNAIRSADSAVPVETSLLAASTSRSVAWSRVGLFLMTAFGVMALVLAAVGIFGVTSFVVGQRRPELAVRMALGSSRMAVFGLVLRYGGQLAAVGAVLGLAVSWWSGRLLEKYLFQVRAENVAVIGGSIVVVLLVTLVAMLQPARDGARSALQDLLR